MLRRIPLRWLFAVTWSVAFLLCSGLLLHQSVQLEQPGKVDWLGAGLVAAAVAGLVVVFVKDLQDRPTPEQLAALEAIFQAGPGTIGAIVVKRNGVPEVIATVRSREEYLELAATDRLPVDHIVFLPDDMV